MLRFFRGPWVAFACVVFPALLLSVGLYCALYVSPADYRQGDVVRVMYLHVPSAWISLGAYSTIALCSLIILFGKGKTVLPTLARAIAPIGACFTVVCLVTGSIWGKHTWGTWWVWDARLTSMLLMLFLYIGYVSLWNVFEYQQRAIKATSLFAVFSAVNVPIVKLSVNIWATLHQPASIMRREGIAIDPSMLMPLLIMFVALSSLFVALTILRINTLIKAREVKEAMVRFYQQI